MPKARVYNQSTGQWIYLDAKDADTVDGKHASDFALASHNHDDRYFTETEADTRFAPKTHDHNTAYYTKTELNTTGGAVHWNVVTNKPSTFTPATHNHDDNYYTETESDNKYLQKSDNLLALTDKSAARTNLGLGSIATASSSSYSLSNHNHDTTYIKGNGKMSIGTTAPSTPTTNEIWIDIN